jgi:hypothetical protein
MMLRGLKKLGSFEPFSEIVSVPSQKINELVEKRLQPELEFYVWLREYGHISVDCTIHCCCDSKDMAREEAVSAAPKDWKKRSYTAGHPSSEINGQSTYIGMHVFYSSRLTPTSFSSWLTSR